MSEMTVGCIRTTVNPTSGIYEALLEKAEKDNAELADRLSGLELSTAQELAKLEKERNHYKSALEEISQSVDDWLNSLIQEPSLDFIHAIKSWADKKLKEI